MMVILGICYSMAILGIALAYYMYEKGYKKEAYLLKVSTTFPAIAWSLMYVFAVLVDTYK